MPPVLLKIRQKVKEFEDDNYAKDCTVYVTKSTYREIFDKTDCTNLEDNKKCLGYKLKIDDSIPESKGFEVRSNVRNHIW